jgi:predicted DNA-binding transcriptional regulator YafY
MTNPVGEIEYDKSEGKAVRLLELYFYIEEHPGVKADELVDLFKISSATLYRDIQTLRRIGIAVDVESTNRGGYRIEKGNIRFARIKAEEIRPLLIARELLNKLTFPQGEIFDRLLNNMLNTIREGEITRIEEQMREVLYFRAPLNRRFSMEATEQVSILSKLLEASMNKWQVELTYPSSTDGLAQRTIDPYGLWFGHNAWYVAGWCHKRRALRTFAVDRIGQLKLFENKSFQKQTNFDLAAFVETSWIAMPSLDNEEEVELEFEYRTGCEIAESSWHHSQYFYIPDSELLPVLCRIKLSKTSLESEFLTWILSFGPKVKIIKPQWLIDTLKTKLSLWKKLYKG